MAKAVRSDKEFTGGSQGVLMTWNSHHTKGMPPIFIEVS